MGTMQGCPSINIAHCRRVGYDKAIRDRHAVCVRVGAESEKIQAAHTYPSKSDMEFLCIPGAFCNANTFKAQLAPLLKELESDDSARFHFTQGTIEATPPPEFEGYFGPPPNYRFMSFSDEFLNALRSIPSGKTEDALEALSHVSANDKSLLSAKGAVDFILEQLEQNDKIRGLVGYSEGAGIAASAILEEQRRKRETGRTPRAQTAVFIAGWPAVDIRSGRACTADDMEEVLTLPTCHVIGAEDVFVEGSKALYELCDMDTAEFFDHGGGHIIPRNQRTLKELADVIRNMIRETSDK